MNKLSSFSECNLFSFFLVLWRADPNGHVYQSLISVRGPGSDEGAKLPQLPRTVLLSIPVGEELLGAASAIILDDAHVAVVGVPHPSAGPGKGKCRKCYHII